MQKAGFLMKQLICGSLMCYDYVFIARLSNNSFAFEISTSIPDHFIVGTPQPLNNTIVGVQTNFRVSYPIRVITRVKCRVIYQNQSLMGNFSYFCSKHRLWVLVRTASL